MVHLAIQMARCRWALSGVGASKTKQQSGVAVGARKAYGNRHSTRCAMLVSHAANFSALCRKSRSLSTAASVSSPSLPGTGSRNGIWSTVAAIRSNGLLFEKEPYILATAASLPPDVRFPPHLRHRAGLTATSAIRAKTVNASRRLVYCHHAKGLNGGLRQSALSDRGRQRGRVRTSFGRCLEAQPTQCAADSQSADEQDRADQDGKKSDLTRTALAQETLGRACLRCWLGRIVFEHLVTHGLFYHGRRFGSNASRRPAIVSNVIETWVRTASTAPLLI